MKLTKEEKEFILRNERIILSILKKRIDDLKEYVIDASPEDREKIILWIKEYRGGLSLLRELTSEKTDDNSFI